MTAETTGASRNFWRSSSRVVSSAIRSKCEWREKLKGPASKVSEARPSVRLIWSWAMGLTSTSPAYFEATCSAVKSADLSTMGLKKGSRFQGPEPLR